MKIKFLEKNFLVFVSVLSLPILFTLQQYISKPLYDVTGVITIGKLFERPIINPTKVIREIKSYKHKKIYQDILYDVYFDDSEERFNDNLNKEHLIHTDIIIKFRGKDKDILREKLTELLENIKANHDNVFHENTKSFKKSIAEFLKFKSDISLSAKSTIGNFECQHEQYLQKNRYQYKCFNKFKPNEPIFTIVVPFSYEIFQFYNRFRSEGPTFENNFFGKTDFIIHAPIKTGISIIKSMFLTTLFLIFCIVVIYSFFRDINDRP